MPLCKLDRNRTQTCLQEHNCLESDIIGCGFVKRLKSQEQVEPNKGREGKGHKEKDAISCNSISKKNDQEGIGPRDSFKTIVVCIALK